MSICPTDVPHGIALRPTAVERAAALLEGAAVRHRFNIRHIGHGVINAQVRGPRAVLERIGLASAFASDDPPERRRDLAWVAVPRVRYALGVFVPEHGGMTVPSQLDRAQLCPAAGAATAAVAYINGGFFNYRQMADPEAAECSTVGEACLPGRQLPCLRVPDDYEEDYHRLQADNDASLMVAPRLSRAGRAVFTEDQSKQERYQAPSSVNGSPDIQPGSLKHAAMRHPRAAISYPPTASAGMLRMITGRVADRNRDPGTGYTLGEWSSVCARLDRLGVNLANHNDSREGTCTVSQAPNSSSNLDGGNSVAMGALVPGQTPLRVSQSVAGRPVPNLVMVTERNGR